MEGTVFKSTGSWYAILAEDGIMYSCRVRGKLRIQGLKTTNPLAVGDQVIISVEDKGEHIGLVEKLVPRKNYIIRQAVKKASQAHILASNIDQAMLIATETYPKTSQGFIDRFLVTAESYRIPQVIVFNKTDLLNQKQTDRQKEKIEIYANIGVTCIETSALENLGIDTMEKVLANKTTLISGHSGVGKSTLINIISPEVDQKIGDISDFAQKGVHTTTFAEMFKIDANTFIIDTPGIKELGLIEIENYELSDYFPEMRALSNNCKFNNCLHIDEPKCAIKESVENGIIHHSRYLSYLSMIEGQDNRR